MQIALGSVSPHKIQALQQACRELVLEVEVRPFPTASGVNEQPVGFEETLAGAKARAVAAAREYPTLVCVGIENGVLRHDGITIELAVIAVRVPWKGALADVVREHLPPQAQDEAGEWYVATSPGIRFPELLVQEAERRGFKTCTVGSVIAETFRGRGDGTDPHAILTTGEVTRSATLVEGLRIALAQLMTMTKS